MALKETIKNLFGKALTLGTPRDKKALLYSEVIKTVFFNLLVISSFVFA
jgi:hypothetical protein